MCTTQLDAQRQHAVSDCKRASGSQFLDIMIASADICRALIAREIRERWAWSWWSQRHLTCVIAATASEDSHGRAQLVSDAAAVRRPPTVALVDTVDVHIRTRSRFCCARLRRMLPGRESRCLPYFGAHVTHAVTVRLSADAEPYLLNSQEPSIAIHVEVRTPDQSCS